MRIQKEKRLKKSQHLITIFSRILTLFTSLWIINPAITQENFTHVILSEFMAININTLTDGDGEYSDWIELYNPTSEAVNLNSYYLTDDLSDLTKWQFPTADTSDITLAPGEYLLIFASGKDTDSTPYQDTSGYLHTNFKLSGSSEDIALILPDGQTIIHQYKDYPQQFIDVSYGTSEISDSPGFLYMPTPGDYNSEMYTGTVKDTKFSVNRGFYQEPFDLEITTKTEEAEIRYTLDGSEPTLENGFSYTEPIQIEASTVLRAAAFKDGYLPSNVDTQTYLFVSDIITQSADGSAPDSNWPSAGSSSSGDQGGFPGWNPGRNPGGSMGGGQVMEYGMDPDVVEDASYADLMDDAMLDIPSLSIVTALVNLFDTSTGIYMNAQQDGREWERPISLELINPDGSGGFQVNAGLRIRGGVSRSSINPKHNFRLFFRPEYGAAQLNFPLFDDEGVDEFVRVDLRTGQNFSWHYSSSDEATWLYDVFARDTEGAMGKPYTRSRFYHLYINGQYWGLYQTEERPEANFGASYLGGDPEDYDTIKADNDNGTIYAVDGDLTAYDALWTEISAGVSSNDDYFRLQGLASDGLTKVSDYEKYLDVDSLIDYMLVIYYTADRDCPLGPPGSNSRPRNLYAVYNRKNPDGFQFITHDNEWSLLAGQSSGRNSGSSGVNSNRVSASLGSGLNRKNYFNPWWLHNELMADSAEYRLRFADRVYKHFFNEGALTAANCAARFETRKEEIDLAIIGESARWGDSQNTNQPRTKDDDWLPAVNNNLNNFILASPSTRTDIVFNQIKAEGWYPNIDPPTFNQHGGEIDVGFSLTISAATGVIFYTLDGTDPRLPGGAINPNKISYSSESISLNQSTRVLARVYIDYDWSALADATFTVSSVIQESLRITEIHYHPADPSEEEITAGYDDGDDFEYIELINANDEQTIDLSNVRFVNGIEFDFSSENIPLLGPTNHYCLSATKPRLNLGLEKDALCLENIAGN